MPFTIQTTQRSGFDESAGGDSSRGRGRGRGRGAAQPFPAMALPLIQAKGYKFPELEQRSWPGNIAKAEKDGRKVALKPVGPKELDMLTGLQKPHENHVVKLIDAIHFTDDITIIVMPWLSPLGNRFSSPSVKSSLVAQLLEGVLFLHKHGIAHLDLKPGNILVEQKDRSPPRLSIIDFGVSVRVQDEETTVTGFRGTPYWTAPEVGTKDGPEMTYSAIRADRWSCGRMLEHFYSNDDASFRDVRKKLLHSDPSRRPSLDNVLQMVLAENSHSGGKRGIDKDAEGATPKRARNVVSNMEDQ